MKILAADPSTKFGWAHSCGQSGTWDLSIRRDESAGMRLLRLRGKLEEVYKTVGVDFLAFESARHAAPGMQGALVVQSEIQGVLKLWCEERKIEYRGYSPSEVKKHATGKGGAKKDKMVAAAIKRWKKVVEDEDEADALCVLSLAMRDLGL